jgi:hypothetical protein
MKMIIVGASGTIWFSQSRIWGKYRAGDKTVFITKRVLLKAPFDLFAYSELIILVWR